MSKTNKELAIDVAVAYIEAHTKQIIASPNNIVKETTMISLEAVNNIINSVYTTLDSLSPEQSE